MDANPLILRFIMAAKLALDLSAEHLDQARDLAAGDVATAAYDQFIPWAGSDTALIEVLAYARTASFYVWHGSDEYAHGILKPIWDEVCVQVPGICLEWYTMGWTRR